MGTRIKLTDAGSSHTLLVKAVTVNKSGNWPDYEFTDGSDTVVVPQKAADRQIGRLGVQNISETVGRWITVSRSTEAGANGKHFWNLDVATGPAQAGRVTSPYRAPSAGLTGVAKLDEGVEDGSQPGDEDEAPARLNRVSSVEAEYQALFERTAAFQSRIGAEYQIPVDGSSVQAMCYSLFAASRR